ncbi:MAG: hypothetical protein AAFP70_01405 [Calditrichota bacterium]
MQQIQILDPGTLAQQFIRNAAVDSQSVSSRHSEVQDVQPRDLLLRTGFARSRTFKADRSLFRRESPGPRRFLRSDRSEGGRHANEV